MEKPELFDNAPMKQYELQVGDPRPRLKYAITPGGEIELLYTHVPVSLAGRGLGSTLLELAFEGIDRRGLRVVPRCPFVMRYINNHPKWQRLTRPRQTPNNK